MKFKLWHHLTLSSLIALSCATSAWAHPEIFSDLKFDQAKQQAQSGGKLLLIDFTATWCPPCRKMETSTWTDEELKKWVKENAIAIQVDVDQDPKTSSKLEVEAMPTMVLFTPKSGDKEFGRQVGYMDASSLLEWLEGAKSGKTAEEIEKASDDNNSVWERLGKARAAEAGGKNAEAVEEYLWIWNNVKIADTNMRQVRDGMVPVELKKFVKKDAATKEKITALRDAAEKADDRHDWILLNGMLDEPDKVLAWFDKAKVDPQQREKLKPHQNLLEGLLLSKARYTDIKTHLFPDPVARVNELHKQAKDMMKPRPDTDFAKDFDPFPPMIITLYCAYIGANDEAGAKKIFDECMKLDDTTTMRETLESTGKSMRAARAAAPQNKTVK